LAVLNLVLINSDHFTCFGVFAHGNAVFSFGCECYNELTRFGKLVFDFEGRCCGVF